MDGSPPLRERASRSYGIRHARHGADTTERRNHLGGTPQQQRQPQCTGIHSPGTRPGIAGKYLEAQTLATEKVMAKTNSGMPYQSFGDLRIAFPGHTRYTNYYRELSLDSARTLVRYEVDGVQYRRETITSFTDQVIMVRLTANRPGRITFNAQLTSPHQDVVITSEEGNCVTLSGVSSLHEGLKGKVEFQGRLTARNTGGRMACADGVLQ